MLARRAATLDRLDAMTDERGLFEHARRSTRRVEHGYCTDDNARMLVVTAREPDSGLAFRLSRIALSFTRAAQQPDGRVRNRMDAAGHWTDRPTTDDCWGRSLWGLGVAANRHGDPTVRGSALAGFDVGIQQRSPWRRAMAFAALGAADVLDSDPAHVGAHRLLDDCVVAIGEPGPEPWVWPELRLTFANATLAEATIAGGAALRDRPVLDRGLAMLGWLLRRETIRGHLSVTGTAGRSGTDSGPQFDQQPIEAAAMADACWRAYTATGDSSWVAGVSAAAGWFDGANDAGAVMRDNANGASFDGLLVDGVNLNQGAESTLALISTAQRARTLERVAA